MDEFDVIIIGAGAAGLMCAAGAGKRGRRVLVLDHAAKPAEKIRISGGGRCNFTNLHCGPDKFISNNPHFCKSALSRFTQHDFIALVERHGIAWHEKAPEKKLGQLFCDGRSQAVIDMLLAECAAANATIRLETAVESVARGDRFAIRTSAGAFGGAALVIATGGPSIPKMGATGFAYDVAKQFGLNVIAPRPALVPLTFTDATLDLTRSLSGVAVDPAAAAAADGTTFREALLFTHRGLSGPAILQISSYWREGEDIVLDLMPGGDALGLLKKARAETPRQKIETVLAARLPARLADAIAARTGCAGARVADLPDTKLKEAALHINRWRIKPNGSEGYRTAEVTLGGIDTGELSSRTFEAAKAKGLYFIGEALDVTGHLGGHNFQWAWSSGWCAGQAV
jgi:predicted Rossmann fold flavoprotein